MPKSPTLARLEATRDRYRSARQLADDERRQRDALVAQAIDEGGSYAVVARAGGISKTQVWRDLLNTADEPLPPSA